MPTTDHDSLLALLRPAHCLLVFTGAGISTGSGIRDFRGPQGIWKTRPPVYYQDFMTSEAARIDHWDYKLEAWQSFRDAKPNSVHQAITDLHQAGRLHLLVTQNIDGLHEASGLPRDRLVEIHGTNAWIECQTCGELTEPGPHFRWFADHRASPLCTCGGYLKPATISFGQAMREADLRRAFEGAGYCDLVISLGTTLSVQPAASVPLVAAERGVPYVIINRGPTDHDDHPQVTLRLEGDVSVLFPPVVQALLGE